MPDSRCLKCSLSWGFRSKGQVLSSNEQEGSCQPLGVSNLGSHWTVMAKKTRQQESGHSQGKRRYSPSLALRYSGFEEAYSGPSGPSGCLEEKKRGIPVCGFSQEFIGHYRWLQASSLQMRTLSSSSHIPVLFWSHLLPAHDNFFGKLRSQLLNTTITQK